MSFFGFPFPPGPGPAPQPNQHNLLSSTHSDTTAATPPAAGSVISAPSGAWAELPVGLEGQVLTVMAGVPEWEDASGSGIGDVTGPNGATPNSVAIYNSSTGKIIKESLVIITDAGDVFIEGNTTISGDLTVLGNTNLGNVINSTTTATGVTFTISNTFFNAVNPSVTTIVNMPGGPTTGQTHVIKDITGNAASINVTVLGNGNTIDGLASTSLVNNYEALTLLFGPSEWNLI